ncbi:macrolide transporter subunit MacA [Phyllobacterium brassicacearum]|uniref:Macrolide transporter subunit MacA n=1 Tax=Phyllobacterium brassicacearum TaxID=314235 RepID=A0A2P7BCZ8_9HYPH|nr:efflux RND transporter periplasmic adaptor subunit [Phyllobacterium brassicacearum]PSH64336.1 macrolide transporter subunit MacA [Phyllobacterium brassicacearum]TDQ21254.1 macrolide-specific efflux system membrane fusion protein [Phyllobacterium brassicacearum]
MTETVRTAKQDKASPATSNVTFIPGAVPPRRTKRRSRLWIWLPVVLAVAGTGYYAWSQYKTSTAAASVVTQVVVRGDIENAVTAVGTLDSIKSVDAGAQVSGQLKVLHVDIGDKVTQNQLIGEIDPATIQNRIEIDQAELANLQAQLVSKQAQLVLKQANIDRQRNLVATRSVSQSTLDQAIADLAAAEADVNALEAQIRKQQATLAGDQVDLGYTKIYAPMAGTIAAVPVKEGQTLNASQTAPTIATIADLSTMTVKAQVSEADVSKLKIGMDAYFTLLGQPGKRYTGKLRQIQPTPDIENNVVLYYALFDVPNPDGDLMISMSAQVFFVQSAAKDVLVVPSSAISLTGGSRRDSANDGSRKAEVTVVTPAGATETREVEVGIRNRVNAEIKSGVKEGELVVVGSDSDTGGTTTSRGTGNRSQRGMRMPPMF